MDGNVKATGIISGELSYVPSLSGSLSPPASMSGSISIPTYIDVDMYDGEYEMSPDFDGATLPTTNKTLSHDITINPIRVESVSNPEGGRTVIIGG